MNSPVQGVGQSFGRPAAESDDRSFVVFRAEEGRFALPASAVAELAPPVRLHVFPHTTPLLEGVIVRRGHIVPVYRASVLDERTSSVNSSRQRFYLVARRGAQEPAEFAAIPVAGECELVSEELRPADSRPAHVLGVLTIAGESIDVLDLNRLLASGESTADLHAGVEAGAQS